MADRRYALQETTDGLQQSAEAIRPTVERTASQLQEISSKLNESSPRIERSLARLESVASQVDDILATNRTHLQTTLLSVKDLSGNLADAVTKNRPRVEQLMVNIDGTRARTDRLLYQADQIAGVGMQILAKNRADLERTLTNVRDATEWADKLVQKIYANPFVLSPLYKPTPEDIRVQSVYDTAHVFSKGASELNDLVKTLETMQAKATTPAQQQEILQLRQAIHAATQRLGETSHLLSEGLKRNSGVVRARR
jgi:phospholipid/cholesterol/gamma-HCH transport system substrate-binding protein